MRRCNTTRAANPERIEPKFHSLRVYRRTTLVERGRRIRSTSTIMVPKANWTCPEHTVKKDEAPIVPDRKMKPKFFHVGKSKRKDDEDNDWCGLEDNTSLLSGIQRLSWSPAPTPAPRKSLPNGAARCVITKHTYQNVPIPISPNNSQDLSDPSQQVLYDTIDAFLCSRILIPIENLFPGHFQFLFLCHGLNPLSFLFLLLSCDFFPYWFTFLQLLFYLLTFFSILFAFSKMSNSFPFVSCHFFHC